MLHFGDIKTQVVVVASHTRAVQFAMRSTGNWPVVIYCYCRCEKALIDEIVNWIKCQAVVIIVRAIVTEHPISKEEKQ